MKPTALIASLFGAVVMLGFALWKTTPWSAPVDSIPPVLLMVAWVVSPYLPLTVAAAISRTKAGAAVAFALGLVATLVGTVVYADAFLRHESPVYALLFLSIPVLQWGIGVAAIVAAVVVRGRQTTTPR